MSSATSASQRGIARRPGGRSRSADPKALPRSHAPKELGVARYTEPIAKQCEPPVGSAKGDARVSSRLQDRCPRLKALDQNRRVRRTLHRLPPVPSGTRVPSVRSGRQLFPGVSHRYRCDSPRRIGLISRVNRALRVGRRARFARVSLQHCPKRTASSMPRRERSLSSSPFRGSLEAEMPTSLMTRKVAVPPRSMRTASNCRRAAVHLTRNHRRLLQGRCYLPHWGEDPVPQASNPVCARSGLQGQREKP